MSISRKEFLTVCVNKPQQAKAILKDEAFNEVGLEELLVKNEEACVKFFTDLIGQDFDPKNDQHHVKVLEDVVGEKADPEKVADAMVWYCENFTLPVPEKPVKQPEEDSRFYDGKPFQTPTSDALIEAAKSTFKDSEKPVQALSQSPVGSSTAVKSTVEACTVALPLSTKKKECRGKSTADLLGQKIPFHEGSKQYLVIAEMEKFKGTKREFHKHMKTVFEAHEYKANNIANCVWRTLVKYGERGGTVDIVDACYVVSRKTDGQ